MPLSFQKITTADLSHFRSILPPGRVLSDGENRMRCAADATEDYIYPPEVVLQPETTEEVSSILSYCNDNHICVTPRGAGTGLSGGALPVYGGICLDMCRMNRILKIDKENFQVITEPGVITEILQQAVIAEGLYYPVDPASRGSCFIGGNVAENSGGPRAVKYGTVKDYVLNLEIVLPNGNIVWTGANTLKNATGLNLTQLLVGSEGTLAVITRIVLKLLPYPSEDLLMLVSFAAASEACRMVNRILTAGFLPSALEFMERDALLCAREYLQDTTLSLPETAQAHLLIEVNGNDRDLLMNEMEAIAHLIEASVAGDILLATDAQQKERLWRLRRAVGEAAKSISVYKEEDTVVPRAQLPALLEFVKSTGARYGFRSICYGHAGDGNLHVNILKEGLSDDFWNRRIPEAIREIFRFVQAAGGTLSGEHGIGYVQRPYLDIVFPGSQRVLMQAIKHSFDPAGILNPGKAY